MTAVALAANPATGGYRILKSDGGVDSYNARWYGSLRGIVPAGQVTGLAADTASGGYLILKSNGGWPTITPPGTAP